MAWFEVFIPASAQMPNHVTLTIEGQNWMDALRTGLANIGQGPISNIMCDIQPDNSIHVTDTGTRRVFRLRETAAPGGGISPPAAPAPAPRAAAPAPAPAPAPRAAMMAAVAVPAAAPAPRAAAPAPAPAPPPQRAAQFHSGPAPAMRAESQPTATDPALKAAEVATELDVTDAIADVFDATQDLLMSDRIDPKAVADTLLDLALRKIPAEAGTFYLADVNGHDLHFTAVRGPKADALRRGNFSVKVGQGIIGFCAQEGVCLVIRDMQHDNRYFAAIAEAIGYQPRDTLCASAEKDGRLFGAIQLINSKRGSFTSAEMELMRYLGLTAAEMLGRAAEG